MEVIADDHITEQFLAVADDRVLQSGDELASVGVIADDLLTAIAARHDVLDGAIKLEIRFDPEVSRSVDRETPVRLSTFDNQLTSVRFP